MLPSLLRHPPDTLGRRGASLLIYGAVWAILAVSILTRPGSPETDLLAIIPTPVHAGIWVVASAIALTCAFRRTPGADTAGFVALIVVAFARAATYAWAWGASFLPVEHIPHDDTGWLGALAWGLIALKVYTDAGWPESPGVPTSNGMRRDA